MLTDMANEIQVLKQTELLGRQFAVYGTAEEPLFLAKDVAAWIGHTDPSSMMKMVDADEKKKIFCLLPETNKVRKPCESNTYNGANYLFLKEDGVYEVLMQSNLPTAKQFKKGVKAILKEIRTTGAYITTNAEETDEELMARALAAAERAIKRKEERIKQLEKDTTEQRAIIIQKDGTIEAQEKEIKKSAPKVNYYDEHLQSVNTVTTTQIANEIGIEGHKLNQMLREKGIIYKQSGQWLLRVPYNGWELHATRTQTFTRSDGSVGSSSYTVWTQKGRMFIIRLSENEWDVKKAIKTIKGELA